MLQKIKKFMQKEVVLCVAAVLAVVSMFLVHPDKTYADYIDFRTLAILFCLMCVMAGLQKTGVFRRIAEQLLKRVHGNTQVILILVMLCFFFSMLITNDVALITFVPFTFTVGKLLGEETYRRMMLPVVVLQTIAANLGSMLTPIGNPQNLYLYGLSGMGTGEFMLLMLPYTALSFGMLAISCVVFGRKLERMKDGKEGDAERKTKDSEDGMEPEVWKKDTQSGGEVSDKRQDGLRKIPLTVYLILFVICLLTVARILPVVWMFVLVAVAVFFVDGEVFARVDYCLLLTFVAFFVFIGNMGRIPAFARMLGELVKGNEVWVAVVASQLISNVPAALLLSGFTDGISALIVGVNLGGLGTLIASMASLISYKYVAVEVREQEIPGGRAKYLACFTVAGICFLAALVFLYYVYSLRL